MISLPAPVCEISASEQFVRDDPDAEMTEARKSRYDDAVAVSHAIN
jgi:hypothetical protein